MFAFQAGLWPSAFARFTTNAERWEALKDLNALLLGLGALSIIAVWAAFTMWLRRIPCANRRHATLTRRTLDDIVPRGVRVVMYAAIGVTLAAWIATAVVNVPGTPRFWGRLAALAVVLGTVVFFISFSVRRPPHAMDRLFGPAYRADEVRFAFSLLLLIPLGGAVRLYEELNNTTVTDLNRLMHLAVALLVTIWAVRLTSYSTGTSGGSQANAGRLVPNRAERARGRHRLLLRETFMKTVLRSFVFAAVLGTAASAQGPNLLGNWQGVLQAGPQQLRIVVVITSGEGGRPAATLYSIDQTPTGTAGSVTLQGSAIRISVPTLGATFDGKLSADGNSIPGTFAQGGGSLPFTLTRATKDTAFPLPAQPVAMAADAPMAFAVATIKPSNPNAQGKLFTIKGPEVLTINTSLIDMMSVVYGVHPRQILGAPAWAESDKYDITGRPEAQGVPNQRQLRGMLQKLMEDRFKLTTHTEKRDLPVYALTVGGGGHKLTRNDSNPNGLPGLLFRGLGVLPALNATMGDFANVMQTAVLDRPVVDRTGLQGRFDFTLTWTPDDSQFRSMGARIPPPPADGSGPPGLFTAIQEQLGLKLDSSTGPADVIVIDRVEKPSDN